MNQQLPWKLGRMASGLHQTEWPTREEAMAFFDRLRRGNYPKTIPGAILWGPNKEKWVCEGTAHAEWVCQHQAEEDDAA